MLMAASLAHTRPLTSAAARLVPQPPDLIKWVRREGGFVHQSIKIARLESDPNELGLGLVASNDIPKGSELIALPHRIPLKFEDKNEDFPILMNLARHIPGMFFFRGIN